MYIYPFRQVPRNNPSCDPLT
uniref:Uncharacterized protein n=1 Tax=Anguilla anguilla TaxID=7936 RepID=A0A0E9RX62_ANGAN